MPCPFQPGPSPASAHLIPSRSQLTRPPRATISPAAHHVSSTTPRPLTSEPTIARPTPRPDPGAFLEPAAAAALRVPPRSPTTSLTHAQARELAHQHAQ